MLLVLQHLLSSITVVICTKLQMSLLISTLFKYILDFCVFKVKHFIKFSVFQVCQEEEFLQLSSCQLVALIRRDHLNVREERDVYNAVLKVKMSRDFIFNSPFDDAVYIPVGSK